jgi:hypothetical protein
MAKEEKDNNNVINAVIGLAVLFGTVWLVSKAWKKGQV